MHNSNNRYQKDTKNIFLDIIQDTNNKNESYSINENIDLAIDEFSTLKNINNIEEKNNISYYILIENIINKKNTLLRNEEQKELLKKITLILEHITGNINTTNRFIALTEWFTNNSSNNILELLSTWNYAERNNDIKDKTIESDLRIIDFFLKNTYIYENNDAIDNLLYDALGEKLTGIQKNENSIKRVSLFFEDLKEERIKDAEIYDVILEWGFKSN